MGAWAAFAVPYAASLGLLLAPFPETALSRAALALLPWVAWAGLPRARARDVASVGARDVGRGGAWGSALTWIALALPPALVGARLDLLAGADAARTATVGALALASVGALGWAAERAHGARLHAASWLALVFGWPALVGVCSALAPGAAPSSSASTLAGSWASLSPLGWIWRRAAQRDTGAFPWLETCAAFLALALVCACAAQKPARDVVETGAADATGAAP